MLNFGFVESDICPKDLILGSAQTVSNGNLVTFNGLNREALEVVYMVNVGGPKVTPFDDTLWRTRIPDDEFLKSGFGSKAYFSGRIQYQDGGASLTICIILPE